MSMAGLGKPGLSTSKKPDRRFERAVLTSYQLESLESLSSGTAPALGKRIGESS
jgi:hypothetical protein